MTWVPFSRQRRQRRISALVQTASMHSDSQSKLVKREKKKTGRIIRARGLSHPAYPQARKNKAHHSMHNVTRPGYEPHGRPHSSAEQAQATYRSPNLPTSLPSLDAPTTTTLPRRPAHNSPLGSWPRRQPTFKRKKKTSCTANVARTKHANQPTRRELITPQPMLPPAIPGQARPKARPPMRKTVGVPPVTAISHFSEASSVNERSPSHRCVNSPTKDKPRTRKNTAR